MTPNRLARCVLTDATALLCVLLLSLFVTHEVHWPAAILVIQVLAVELLSQAYPLSTLSHDKSKYKPRPNKHLRIEILTFGILAGMIAYASYALFFAYHALSPVYIDTTSFLYMQATTVTFVTLALCQAINILFTRADNHPHVLTDYLLKNKKLLHAFGVSLFLLLNVVYNPLFQSLLNTKPLNIAEWAAAILCAGLYTLIRRLQRYTRQHNRHSVFTLHQELRKTP